MTKFPYAALAARFTDQIDRDRAATLVLRRRAANPLAPFGLIARRAVGAVLPD
jgi:hypothetical protein